MKKFLVSAILLLLPVLSLNLIGCDYITGKALDKSAAAASSLPRWVWNGFVDGYPIVIDRNTKEPLRDVTPDEAFGIIGTSQILDYPIIIDVRTPQEYIDSHIYNAINIDVESSDFNKRIEKLDKNKSYIVYCRTGARSASARIIMEEAGFRHILNMMNGITLWINKGYPVEK